MSEKLGRPTTYLSVERRNRFLYTPKKLHAPLILQLLAAPPEADWFRNRRGFYEHERSRIAANPTDSTYPKHSIMGWISRQATLNALSAALDAAKTWEQRCDVLRILTWRESIAAVPCVARYMGSLVPQERICSARFIHTVCRGKGHLCDSEIIEMAALTLLPER